MALALCDHGHVRSLLQSALSGMAICFGFVLLVLSHSFAGDRVDAVPTRRVEHSCPGEIPDNAFLHLRGMPSVISVIRTFDSNRRVDQRQATLLSDSGLIKWIAGR